MTDFYRLNGRSPVACRNQLEWGGWFETADRAVARTVLASGRVISTVFLGIDHAFSGGPPLLFETMVFEPDGTSSDEFDTARCGTWGHAEQLHRHMIAEVMAVEQVRRQAGGAPDAV